MIGHRGLAQRACWLSAVLMLGCSGPRVELASDNDGGRTMPPNGADGSADGDGGVEVVGLTGLRIAEALQRVSDDGVAPGETVRFRALGTFATGERDVTDEVQWSIDDARLGDIAAGEVTTLGVAGRTGVHATSGNLSADAELEVRLSVVSIEPGAPADAADLFPVDASDDSHEPALAPAVVYPSHETMFPRNLGRVLHQWRSGPALDLFEVRFESELATLRVFTTERSFLPGAELWRSLTDTHAGGSLTFSVRGLVQSAPATVYGSSPVTLFYASSEVLGALYYWSTGAQGIMRSTLSSASASKFFPDPAGSDVTCAACHTVSRDGRKLAVGYGGEKLRQVSVPDRTLQIPASGGSGPGQDIAYGWGTFNPGATRLLYANKGALTLLDADTGEVLQKLRLPGGMLATHPDWSPDGKWVALAVGTGRFGNKDVQGTSLARMEVKANDEFGAPEILLASEGESDTLSFPMHSPDSKTLAFVRGVGKSKDNVTARIFLIPADGQGAAQELTRLNERVNERDGVLDVGNSMPTWAPSTRPGIFWLAFSSLRDYGTVLVGTARDQIWGAALDSTRFGAAEDPSYAAFWMPFQQLEEGNHRAFWALDPDQTCPPMLEICDALDNDCDGVVDEMCCTPSMEVCGNDLDDDCDGTVDDGCGCSTQEDCDNRLDDDCDGLTDGADEDCDVVL